MTRTDLIYFNGKIIEPFTMELLQADSTLSIVNVGIDYISNHRKYLVKSLIDGTEIDVYLPFIMDSRGRVAI